MKPNLTWKKLLGMYHVFIWPQDFPYPHIPHPYHLTPVPSPSSLYIHLLVSVVPVATCQPVAISLDEEGGFGVVLITASYAHHLSPSPNTFDQKPTNNPKMGCSCPQMIVWLAVSGKVPNLRRVSWMAGWYHIRTDLTCEHLYSQNTESTTSKSHLKCDMLIRYSMIRRFSGPSCQAPQTWLTGKLNIKFFKLKVRK